jgi:lipid II:glycine glycyltransferase (peptidoglycan interpeptide bridge formation enzyme)
LKGLSLIEFNEASIQVNLKVIEFYRKYAALKHLIIEDGYENEALRQKILEILQVHIPSALEPKRARSKRTFGRQKKQKIEEVKNYDVKNSQFDCPL